MISRDDFHKPVQLYVVDEARRSWKTLWLRRKERKRLLFAGYMSGVTQSMSMNSPYQLSVDFEDPLGRLQRATTYFYPKAKAEPITNPYLILEEWWAGVRP